MPENLQPAVAPQPSVALILPAGRTGGLVADSLLQEGIAFVEVPANAVASLDASPGVRVAVVAALLTDAERDALKSWMGKGGAVIVLNCDGWPAAAVEEWFGVRPTGEVADGGYLWPSSPDFTLPALPGDTPIQVIGPRRVYDRPQPLVQPLAAGAMNPSAVVCFDAIRDGFADDEWYWCGTTLIQFRRGRCIVSTFEIPTIGPFAPTAAAAGDFNGDGFMDDFIVARGNFYAVAVAGIFTQTGTLPLRIKHILSYPRADSPVWAINIFLEDGSVFQTSFDGGKTFGPAEPFTPGGPGTAPVPTDFGYSFQYVTDNGTIDNGLNVWSQGAFYAYLGTGWYQYPILPDLGPKYLSANIMVPNLGYSGDQNRTGVRDLITLVVNGNVYTRDRATGGFNYPLQFPRIYTVRKRPLVVRNGRAIGFLYDFERTVRQLQQGEEITNAMLDQLVYYTDLGYAVSFTPIINAFDNWVDYTNLNLPQADLHERLLRQAVLSLLEAPLPRVWYLPSGYRSIATLSHDIETAGPGQRAAVRQATMEIARMAHGFGRRDTNFVLTTSGDDGMLSPDDIRELERLQHEVTVHFDSFGSTDFTAANFQSQSNALRRHGLARIPGTRSHGLAWFKDYVPLAVQSQPETVYDSTYGGGPGYSHSGSVLPYRIYSADGSTFQSFYEIPHGLMDIADSDFFFKGLVIAGQLTLPLGDLFERARDMALHNNESLYGFFDSLMHPVVVAGLVPPIPEFFDLLRGYADFLRQENIPSMRMTDMAEWWRKREGLRIGGIDWEQKSRLRFTAGSRDTIENVTLVLAQQFQGKQLQSVRRGTAEVPFKIEQLDGQRYAMFVIPEIAGAVELEATYS